MPRYVYNKKTGKQKKVAQFDTSLMLTINAIITDEAKKYLIRKDNAPSGKLRDFYHTKDNGALVRKIFTTCLKYILIEIATGKCEFMLPNKGQTKPKIYAGYLKDEVVKAKRQKNKLREFDLLQTDYKIPYLQYSFSPNSRKQHLMIYLNKSIYGELVEHANTGKHFSKLPREIDYFLPLVYKEFNYIKEAEIKRLVNFCFRKLIWYLRRGEEIRIIDKDGEIRFFRPLGNKLHDKVMRTVVKKRLTRERKERYDSFS